MPPFVISLPFLHPKPIGSNCAHFNSPSLLSHSFPYITGLDIPKKKPTEEFKPRACTHHVIIIVIIAMLHFVSFHSVTCYTNPLSSSTRVNIVDLLNATCTLVATRCVILGRLQSSATYMTHLNSRALIMCRECVDLRVHRKEVGDNNLGFYLRTELRL